MAVVLGTSLSITRLRRAFVERQPVVVVDGVPPVLIGLLQVTAEQDLEVVGRHIAITAGESFTITCGKASITLTKAGKVVIRGADVLSRSSGINRVKGGSVQIN